MIKAGKALILDEKETKLLKEAFSLGWNREYIGKLEKSHKGELLDFMIKLMGELKIILEEE